MKIIIHDTAGEYSWWQAEENRADIIIIKDANMFSSFAEAALFIDMNFDGIFYGNKNTPYLINETIKTFGELTNVPEQTARFCGWKFFLSRSLWEITTSGTSTHWLKPLMQALRKQYVIVADKPGLVAPRMLSMIVNEALYARGEGISSAADIDTAMKAGTNYPGGPFFWLDEIGSDKIFQLLSVLNNKSPRYLPHHQLNPLNANALPVKH